MTRRRSALPERSSSTDVDVVPTAADLVPISRLTIAANRRIERGEARGWVQFMDDPAAYSPVNNDGALEPPIPIPLAESDGPAANSAPVIDVEPLRVTDTELSPKVSRLSSAGIGRNGTESERRQANVVQTRPGRDGG